MNTTVEAALAQVKPIADAVLYEGYLLYPYRSSATKNQMRWQFGVLMPPSVAAAGTGEHDTLRTECLAEIGDKATIRVQVRFLRLRSRRVEKVDDTGDYQPVESLIVGDSELMTWDEAVEHEVNLDLSADSLARERTYPIDLDGQEEYEPIIDVRTGEPLGRLVRRCWPVHARVRASAEALPGPYGGVRLRLSVANVSDWSADQPGRDQALRHALIACHLVIVLRDGGFISLADPPEWAGPAARACQQEGCWPVLVGDRDSRDTVLVSPIILDDYPSIAPESPVNLFDGTEIDEILTLRTLALTEEEKREARLTDPRARELIDHVDSMPSELWERLHGTVRYLRAVTGESTTDPADVDITARPDVPWWSPGADASVSPETDSVIVDGVAVAKGSRVRLRPGSRRTDAQDMFLVGRTATVRSVFLDVDDERYVAVTLDDDPAADLQNTHGRYRYFAPDEIEPLPPPREGVSEGATP